MEYFIFLVLYARVRKKIEKEIIFNHLGMMELVNIIQYGRDMVKWIKIKQ